MTTAKDKNEAAKAALKDKDNKQAARDAGQNLDAITYETDNKQAILTKRFQEQCFLIDNMKKFAEFNVNHTGYDNLTVITSRDPSIVVNRLVQFPGQEAFMDLYPHEFAALRPKIRLFKVYDHGNGKLEEVELRFSDHHTTKSIEGMLQGTGRTGDGVGIQEFTYMFKGGNPVQVRANMECTFKIFFENLSGLEANRAVEPGKSAHFIDFIRRPLKGQKPNDSTHLRWDKRHFRMKAIIGWAPPEVKGQLLRPEVVEVCRKTTRTMFLELSAHKFNFKENGSAELEMSYVGALEGALTDRKADVFFQTEEDKRKAASQEKKLKTLKDAKEAARQKEKDAGATEAGILTTAALGVSRAVMAVGTLGVSEMTGIGADITSSGDDAETIARKDAEKAHEEAEKEYANDRAASKLLRYNKLLDGLLVDGRIFFQDVTAAEVGAFTDQLTARGAALLRSSGGETASVSEINPQTAKTGEKGTAKKVATALKDKAKEASKAEKDGARSKIINDQLKNSGGTGIEQTGGAVPEGMHRIYFFYYGDLVNAAANCLKNVPDAKWVRLLTGPIVWRNPINKKTQTINLVDVPVSLRLFEQFFLEQVVKPQKGSYLFLNFLSDTMGRLIAKAMGEECFAGFGVNVVRPDIVPIMAPANSKGQDKIRAGKTALRGGVRVPIESIKNLQVPSHKDIKKVFHYMFAYISGINPAFLKGNEEEDRRQGVYHLYVGKDSGLVKSISWEKVDQPYLAEAQLENAQSLEPGSTPLDVERNKYSATIKMVGNNLFFPGAKIYINPVTMGAGRPSSRNSLARTLGLGGYYTVIEVKNMLTTRTFETILKAKWDSFGGVEAKPIMIKGTRPTLPPRPKPKPSENTSDNTGGGMKAFEAKGMI